MTTPNDLENKALSQFRGLLFRMETWSTAELSVDMQRFEDRFGKPPTHMLVNPTKKIEDIKLPEQYKDVLIQARQYVHNVGVALIGVLS